MGDGRRGGRDARRGASAQERLITRYEHNYFQGWVVTAKRRGKRFVRYFSDKGRAPATSLQEARKFRDRLLRRLPRPTKLKRSNVLNKTGVIGVARLRERTRAGNFVWRYVAMWPIADAKRRKASFSIGLYGEREARRLAVAARHKGVAQFLASRETPSRKRAAAGRR